MGYNSRVAGNAIALLSLGLAGCSLILGSNGDGPSDCKNAECMAAGGTCGPDNTCSIPCTSGTCTCPSGTNCSFTLDGEDITIDCGSAHDCAVRCRRAGSCDFASVTCGTGNCDVSCTAGDLTCVGLQLICGTGPCSLTCAFNGACQNQSAMSCGSATSCDVICQQDTCTGFQFDCGRAEDCSARCEPGGNNTCVNAFFQCRDVEPDQCDLDCGGQPEATCL